MAARNKIDDDKLRKLNAQGMFMRDIAAEMGVVKTSVLKRLEVLGLTPNYERKPRKGKIRKLDQEKLNEGMSRLKEKAKHRMAAKLSPEVIKQAKTHVLALGIKQSGGNPDTAGIIAAIDMQIIHHQNIIDKLTEAKNILI